MDYNTKFVVFSVSEINKVNFDEVIETSANTLRISLDGSKTFIKYTSDEMPTSVASLTTKEGPFDFLEMNVLLKNTDWTRQYDISENI
jgi:hypothetical protein